VAYYGAPALAGLGAPATAQVEETEWCPRGKCLAAFGDLGAPAVAQAPAPAVAGLGDATFAQAPAPTFAALGRVRTPTRPTAPTDDGTPTDESDQYVG
jgi:hypothetical protein